MVPFAGYAMPVHYPMGVMGEHIHTRASAGLFDVSHMGQVIVRGPEAALALERLVPVDVLGLATGRQRYAMFTNDKGGMLDDLMVANRGDHLFLVVNAARKSADLAHMRAHLPELEVREITDRALLALQGPGAEAALDALLPGVAAMRFMDVATFDWQGHALWVSRSGYTGEDGYEISLPDAQAMGFARAALDQPGVAPIGLGARDSLRLEAGLCLYGHDITEMTSPVMAGLAWAIQKTRPRGRRAHGWLSPVPSVSCKNCQRGHWPPVSACAPRGARPCAKARCCGMQPRAGAIWAALPLAGSGPVLARRLPWATFRISVPNPAPAFGARCGASACLSWSLTFRFDLPPTSAEERFA